MSNDIYDGPQLRPGYQGKGTIVYEPLSALSLTQRLGRLRFACYQLTASLMAGLVIALLLLLSQQWIPALAGQISSLVIIIMLAVYLLGLMVRRLHDADKSGWWALAVLVPVANLILMLFLFLAAGSNSVNRYGTPNPPPGVLVILAGGLYWTFNVLSLMASAIMLVMAWQSPERLVEIMNLFSYQLPVSRW